MEEGLLGSWHCSKAWKEVKEASGGSARERKVLIREGMTGAEA